MYKNAKYGKLRLIANANISSEIRKVRRLYERSFHPDPESIPSTFAPKWHFFFALQ